MIKEALEYLIDLGQVKTLDINGQTYATQGLDHVTMPKVKALSVNGLDGMVDYIKSEFDEDQFNGKLIQVVSHNDVRLISRIMEDSGRETYMIANAFPQRFDFGRYYDVESFIIAMQSCFVPNDDSAKILKIVGNIKEEAVKNIGDDGVSQQVTAKVGIATVEDVVLPNPVTLAPYRTFIEVEQPASKFVFRMRSDKNYGPQCALFEADGGAWQLEAIDKIADYLKGQLQDTNIPIIS